MSLYAASHPGKLGDALYTIPTMRHLYEATGIRFDFYTSTYCLPLRELFLAQECVNDFIIPDGYEVKRMDMGVQPWYMPIDESRYDLVYQLGFRSVPDRSIPEFIGLQAGIYEDLSIRYDFPALGGRTSIPLSQPFYVFAPRGETTYTQLFNACIDKLIAMEYGVMVIGGEGDNPSTNTSVIDMTKYNMLDCLRLLNYAEGFVGLMSSQLALANGFHIPRVSPHDGKSWDMRHVVTDSYSHYPINPSVDDVIHLLGLYT